MIKITQIKLPISHNAEALKAAIIKVLKLKNKSDIENLKFKILKKSIDARHNEVNYIYSVEVEISKEENIVKHVHNNNVMLTKKKGYVFPISGNAKMNHSPVVIGSGPAGLFCAYLLAVCGYNPIIIERGEAVDERINSVENFFKTNILNTESNVQFGEGGAGTFSDGKLNTLVKDKFCRNDFVLDTFIKYGADESISYLAKPHIGTDVLSNVVKNMRNDIINLGGQFRFNTKFIDFTVKNNLLNSIKVLTNNRVEEIECNTLILALGHSARDTFKMLFDKRIIMEPKSFAVGVRIEHTQNIINESQYGSYKDKLPAANYKLAKTLNNGRGVYSFCMCPGGYVVNASSEQDRLAVNGMSYSKRDGLNANSAMVVSVTPQDFSENVSDPLAGLEFQRKLETQAFIEGESNIPVQLFADFKNNHQSSCFGEIFPQTKGKVKLSNLRNIFPDYICNSLIEGIEGFNNQIKGFSRNDAVLSGVESRTSSPLRILRNDMYESNINGIYPCGEGAGYAGGITSAAMDGIKVSEAIIQKYAPLTY